MKPTALLGATLRSLTQADSVTNNKGGLFGASLSDGPQSTFGMTLQIPSLPKIDQTKIFNEDGSVDTTQITPTFSFFQPSSTAETEVSQKPKPR